MVEDKTVKADMITPNSELKDKIKHLHDRYMDDIVADGWDPYHDESHTHLLVLQMELEGYEVYVEELEDTWAAIWENNGIEMYPPPFCYDPDPIIAICDAAIALFNLEVCFLVTAVMSRKMFGGQDNYITHVAGKLLEL